jgi:hypothetical protein
MMTSDAISMVDDALAILERVNSAGDVATARGWAALARKTLRDLRQTLAGRQPHGYTVADRPLRVRERIHG